MKIEKCQICGEWLPKNKIAMHYWNGHKKKYSEYKATAEIKEVEEEQSIEVKNEKTEHREVEIKQETRTAEVGTTDNGNTKRRGSEESCRKTEKEETRSTGRRISTGRGASVLTDFGVEHTGWSNSWVENDIDGVTINEWC